MSLPLAKKITIIVTAIIYVIHLIFNGLAAQGTSKLFPRQTGDVSDEFYLEMTPTGATFSIWGFIFVFQLLWIIYTLTTLCRNGNSINILSSRFYVCFNLNIVFIVTWLFLWARLDTVWCFIVILIGQLFIDATIAFACIDLKSFLKTQPYEKVNKVDVWCQRILVQNGLLFYATWTTVATMINTAIVLAYDIGSVSTETASLISLSILGVLAIAWFILENFALASYTEYTFSAYITLIYALTGIFVNINGKNATVTGLVIGLLALAVILLVTRILVLIFRKPRNQALLA